MTETLSRVFLLLEYLVLQKLCLLDKCESLHLLPLKGGRHLDFLGLVGRHA